MSVFTIGRIGVDTSAGGDGTTLQHPFAWDQQGRVVQVAGIYQAASDAAALWFQGQILGLDPLNSVDEDWVPVTSSTASELNGWYRVQSATATIPPASLGNGTKLVSWQATLERAPSWRRPRIDIRTVGAGVTNDQGVTTCTPGQAVLLNSTDDPVFTFGATRTAETGSLTYFYEDATTALSTTTNGTTHVTWSPADNYKGGAYIEHPTLGRVVGRTDALVSDGWRIGNGLIRVKVQTDTLLLSFWNGSAWTGDKAFRFTTYVSSASTVTWRRVVVLRNSPLECSLRIGAAQHDLDVVVRRGERFARVYVTPLTGFSLSNFAAYFDSATPCTDITKALQSTSTINGQYALLMSDKATNKPTPATNGMLRCTTSPAPTRLQFGIGWTGAGAGYPDGPVAVAGQFFFSVGETQRVVF